MKPNPQSGNRTAARSAGRRIEGESEQQPLADLQTYLSRYAKERPEICAAGCLLVGFVLGWKLKPW